MFDFISHIFSSKRKQDIALALGAGGARGLAHIGVLQALDELGYNITEVAGASAGSIVGAMFAFDCDWRVMYRKCDTYFTQNADLRDRFSSFRANSERKRGAFANITTTVENLMRLKRLATETCVLEDDLLRNMVFAMLPDADIRDAKLPLSVVSYDLFTAREVVLREGNVRTAVLASSSIPGVFPPIKHNDMLLVDGGWINPVPIDCLARRANRKIVAVDVSSRKPVPERFDTALEIISRAVDGMSDKIRDRDLAGADFLITPPVGHGEWWQFFYYEEFRRRGYEEALRILPQIHSDRRR